MTTSDQDQLDQLFHTCDLDGSGYLDHEQLASMCSGLTGSDLSDVFTQLDKDGDGRISIEEFAKGYREIAMAKETRKRQLFRQKLATAKSEDSLIDRDETTNQADEYTNSLNEGLRALSCQEEVCELYQNLHSVDKPELVTQFENILLNVINDVHQYQLENERLERTFTREKEEHSKHLRRLEEEMEHQVQSVEDKVRKQEQERLKQEKIELRNQLDSEIAMLKQNLRKLQQDGEHRGDKEDYLVTLKKRLEEMIIENRMLKSELTDAQTNLALIKSQMTAVKHQLDEKNYELEIENKTIADYVSELDKLRRQLNLLHEANRNLLDTNDDLRGLLDSVPAVIPVYRRTSSIDSNPSTKSCQSPSSSHSKHGLITIELEDSHLQDHPHYNNPLRTGVMPKFLTEEGEDDNYMEDLDSGHSTLRDGNDDTEADSISTHSDCRRGRRLSNPQSSLRTQKEDPDSHDDMDTDMERPDSPEETFRYHMKHSPSEGSKSSSRSHRSLTRDESILSQSSRSSKGSTRRLLPVIPCKNLQLPAPISVSREPERMYKLAMAGDAAVGKSSFLVRLCQGKFAPNLSSTLGVDFQTKMLDVDGHPIALQLWDTAGQERFRSVARTYFRRSDGVFLLYDVTYERSFLNLREWVDAIKEGSAKKIPIMLVGNKTDARSELEAKGRRVVKYEDGLRLSREIDALFIETSAKNGMHVIEAAIELTRLLRTNEDLEVRTVGMQLQEMRNKKPSSCCKR